MSGRNKRIVLFIICLISAINLHSTVRAMWVTPWDMNSEEKVIKVVQAAQEWGITDLLVEVRYRGDALYQPNRTFFDFPNPEPVSYLLRDNQTFDPLQKFIDLGKHSEIKIHAWVTVLVTTPRVIDNLSENHLFYKNPSWLTHHKDGKRILNNQFEGAYIDPGIKEVQDYLVNVFSDIVQNYEIDGLHLDYIRYPHKDYGYHPLSIKNFNKDLSITDYEIWKEQNIINLVRNIKQSVKKIKPQILYSAAVFPDIEQAKNRYSQNWYKWLDLDLIDQVFIMAYQTNNDDFERIITKIPEDYRSKTVVGLRAWSDDGSYKIQGLKDKIAIVNIKYAGICFFSYGGIISRNYQKALLESKTQASKLVKQKSKIEGFVYGLDGKPLSGAKIFLTNNPLEFTFSDNNGYYIINKNNDINENLTCQYMNFTQSKISNINNNITFNLPVFSTSAVSLKIDAISTETGIFIWWDVPENIGVSLYRKSISSKNTLDEKFTLLGNFNSNSNFYYDKFITDYSNIEYQLIDENMLSSAVYRVSPEKINHLLETKLSFNNQKILFEILNKSHIEGKWSLKDITQNIIAQGDSEFPNEIVIPELHLEKRYLFFNYNYDNQTFIKIIDLSDIKEKI